MKSLSSETWFSRADRALGSQPEAREVPVEVSGTHLAAGAGTRELFNESTETTLVCEDGAVVRLSAAIVVGQLLFLKHRESQREIVTRVLRQRSFGEASAYVEIEFTEAAPGFWGGNVPVTAMVAPLMAQAPAEASATKVLADDAATELYELLTNSASKEVAVPRKEIAGLGLQLSALLESDSSQQPAEKSRPPALTIADIAPVPTSAPEVPPSFSDEQDASVEEEIPGGEEPSGEPGNLNEEVGVEQGAEPSATGNTQFRIRLLAALLILAVLTGAAYEKGVLGDWIVNRGVTASTERATGSSTAAVITKRSPASAVPEMALAGSPGEDVTVSDSLRNNGAAAASDAVTADRGEEAMLRKTGRSASTVIEGRQGARVVLASNDGAVPATDSMGDGYEPPRLVKAVNAVPPPEAVQDFVTGDVKFDALVDATGKVSSASVLSGPAALQAAALEALRRYEYKPAIKNGQSVPGHVTVSVKFWYEP